MILCVWCRYHPSLATSNGTSMLKNLSSCVDPCRQVNAMHCGKKRISVSVGLFWDYVSVMIHCG